MLVPLPAPCHGQEGEIKVIGGGTPQSVHPPHPLHTTPAYTPVYTTPTPQLLPIACHPALFASINAPMQKFRGESAAWPEFRRKWMERLGLLQASGPVDEKILLTQFLECVDPTTKREIEARRAEEPNLGYQQIFHEVDQRFSRTVRQTSRAKLQALNLQWVKGERVTMREFSKFDADFRILKADCRGMGEDEAKNIYQSALPLFLAEAVQKELLRKERRPTALLQGLGPIPIKQTREWLDETLSTTFHHISNENGNFVVHCADDTQFRKLMGLNGRALTNGQNISVTARDAQVSLEEIRKICHDLL